MFTRLFWTVWPNIMSQEKLWQATFTISSSAPSTPLKVLAKSAIGPNSKCAEVCWTQPCVSCAPSYMWELAQSERALYDRYLLSYLVCIACVRVNQHACFAKVSALNIQGRAPVKCLIKCSCSILKNGGGTYTYPGKHVRSCH